MHALPKNWEIPGHLEGQIWRALLNCFALLNLSKNDVIFLASFRECVRWLQQLSPFFHGLWAFGSLRVTSSGWSFWLSHLHASTVRRIFPSSLWDQCDGAMSQNSFCALHAKTSVWLARSSSFCSLTKLSFDRFVSEVYAINFDRFDFYFWRRTNKRRIPFSTSWTIRIL